MAPFMVSPAAVDPRHVESLVRITLLEIWPLFQLTSPESVNVWPERKLAAVVVDSSPHRVNPEKFNTEVAPPGEKKSMKETSTSFCGR